MKKTVRKLALNRETIRTLQNISLKRVVGGTDASTIPTCYNQIDISGCVCASETCGSCFCP